jgi:hypothetical protein
MMHLNRVLSTYDLIRVLDHLVVEDYHHVNVVEYPHHHHHQYPV